MSLKVLQVIDTLNVGGAEKITVMIGNLMVKKGHDSGVLTIIETGLLSNKLNNNIKYFNLKRSSKWGILSGIKFMKISRDYDLLHIHLRHNLDWVLFWSIIFRQKFNIIFHDHFNKPLKKNLVFKLQKNNISYITVNKHLYNLESSNKKYFIKTYFLENTIIPNYSQKYLPKRDSINLVVISNVKREKNIEYAIKITNLYAKKSGKEKINLDIYYTHSDEKYLKILKQRTMDEHHISVQFIKGELEPQEKLYKYDLALHTSEKESGPLVVLEYIAQGLPLLTFRTGQSIELIKNDFPEFIVSSFYEMDWLRNIEIIISRGRVYYEKHLKSFFKKNYSIENYYSNCIKIYKQNLI